MNDLSPTVITLAGRDYRFGVGPPIVRPQQIHRSSPTQYEGEDWIAVLGIEVRRDGTELGPRVVLVRAAVLAAAVERRARRDSETSSRP